MDKLTQYYCYSYVETVLIDQTHSILHNIS